MIIFFMMITISIPGLVHCRQTTKGGKNGGKNVGKNVNVEDINDAYEFVSSL